MLVSKADVQQVLQEVQQTNWFTNAEGLLRSQGNFEAMQHIGGDCLFMSWLFAVRYQQIFTDREVGLLSQSGNGDLTGHIAASATDGRNRRWFCDPCYFMYAPLSITDALRGQPRKTTLADFGPEHPLILEGSDIFLDTVCESFRSDNTAFTKFFSTRPMPVCESAIPFNHQSAVSQKSHLYIFGLYPGMRRHKWKIDLELATGDVSISGKIEHFKRSVKATDSTAIGHALALKQGTTFTKMYQALQDARDIHNHLHPPELSTNNKK
jgi:hypothetical protein